MKTADGLQQQQQSESMTDNKYIVSNISTTTASTLNQRKFLWIISGIVAGILTITAIVVPTAIILTNKTDKTMTITVSTTEIATTADEVSSIYKDKCMRTYSLLQKLPVGSGVEAILSDDVDGDGRWDIVLGHEYYGKVDILYNNGNGTFTSEIIPDTDHMSPVSIATADANNDGKIDIIILDTSSKRIIVLFNIGDRSFIQHKTYPIGVMTTFLTAADVSGDGYPDIIMRYYDGLEVGILFNDGNGSFPGQVVFHPTECYVSFVATADMNDDNYLDIIALCKSDMKIIILFNNGNGTFVVRTNISSHSNPASVATADVNGDKLLDLIIAHDITDNIVILFNDADNTFSRSIFYSTDDEPCFVAIGDVDNDNKSDIVVVNQESHTIGIFFDLGDGNFTSQIAYSAGSDELPSQIFLEDVNDDDQLDIIVRFRFKARISVLITDCPRLIP